MTDDDSFRAVVAGRLQLIGESQVRLETKIDELRERRDDHEHRLRDIEREKWLVRGGMSVLGLICAKLGLWPGLPLR